MVGQPTIARTPASPAGRRRPAPARAGGSRGGPPRGGSEEFVQRAVADLLARGARPGIAWTHMPAGEARSRGVAGKLKGMGTQPGWPDMLIVMEGRLYGLELKVAGGRLGPAQVAAHALLRAAGAEIAVAVGIDAAIDQLTAWGVLRTGLKL